MKKIKLIWDFTGREPEQFAKHHAHHLEEFIKTSEKSILDSGFEVNDESHAIAYIIVNEEDMYHFRDVLKPHRAVYA
ncbi:MAG: hypothetical protein Q4G27_04450 [Flavobacteriaceae bacterium]|nr:hypothetical protein [Flavobacteriaceae bacterium]